MDRDASSASLLGIAAPTGRASVARNNRPDRVLDVTRQCIALFGRVRSDRTLDAQTKADVENQVGRFKIWAGTIGVFASGRASTDARLRNDEDVKELMIDLLLRLRRAIDAFLKPVILEEIDDDQGSEPADSSDESEASLVLSIGGESSLTSEESKIPSHHLTSLQDLDSTISRLYRLSAIIRKPTSLQENSRVANFIEKVEEGPDTKDFASHVRWQIKFRLPDASDEIAERLASTVMFRKRKLHYRSRHQDKLSQGLESAFGGGMLLPTAPTTPQKGSGQNQRQGGPLLKSAATVKSSSNTNPLSATQASAVNRRALASYPKSLAGGSNITKSAVARRDQLDVPPPPQSGESKEAICPYCFEVVDKARMARPLWTRHILKDIDPYVCLFEGCNRPTEQYQSFDEWITHMQWQHTLVWSCQAPRHTHVRFDTSGDCEAHMRQEHSEDISTEQLILLVEKSAHPAADPFEALIRYDEVNSEARSVCPLCPWAVKSDRIPEPTNLESVSAESGDGMKQMRDHIAAHLESIALLSLPEQENIENAASDEVQSESAKVSSRGADPYEEPLLDTSEAWRSHNEVRWNSESFVEQTDYARDVIPLLVEDEDWTFVTSRIRARSVPLDPGQDPVLVPFVEQARRVQTLELQRRLGIPLIVISDPSGLEVPEAKWSNQPEQLQAHTANVAELHNIGPSSPLADQRKRRIRENRSESVSALENTPSAVTQVTQGIPKIVLIEDSE